MNHFKLSIIKSIFRIAGSIGSIIFVAIEQSINNLGAGLIFFALFYGFAEILGILEEIFDKRKEK